jgi:hypothetical protein
MFDNARTAFGSRGLMHQSASSRCGLPGSTMNIPSKAEGSITLLILGSIVLAVALTGSASIITNYVFDLVGFR